MKPTDLRGILQYVPRFRERIFVIGVDGAIVTGDNFANILLDVAVLRSLNIRVVLVHGASAQISQLAKEKGVTPSDLEGSGRTDALTLELAVAAANQLTHKVLEGLAANSLRAASTNAVIASPLGILRGVDHLNTGKVERVDVAMLETLLKEGITPVVPPLGFDSEGRTYRLNSDHVAVAIAQALSAAKILFMCPLEGLRLGGELLRQVLVSDLETLLAQRSQDFPSDSYSKARHAAAACKGGIPRVHILNGGVDDGLLAEVFSNEGIGTLVYANEYQQIRPALKKDVRNILRLTKESVETEELMKRTRSAIEKHLSDYYIFEIDKNPVACVALHLFPEQGKGELAYLYVSPSHENQGIGRKLVQFVEARAREQGMQELISLSTQAFNFFTSKAGFTEGSPEDLPPARRDQYDATRRNSKILVKKLAPAPSPVPQLIS